LTQRREGAKKNAKSYLKKTLRLSLRLCAFASICFCLTSTAAPTQKSSPYGAPTTLATIKSKEITESSGLVASRVTRGAYWTHNDSGDGPFIYAFDTRGDSLGTFRVTGAQARDWEDMAAGPGPQSDKSYLYIGDIGDNNSARSEVIVYRVAEPSLSAATRMLTKAKPGSTEAAEAIRIKYPDGPHDAEALLVHPTTGNLYIVTKVLIANPSVYEALAPFSAGKLVTMRRLGEARVPSLFGGVITGGSISPDGRRVALCDYFQGYEMSLPAGSTNFDEIWKQRMTGFDLGKRKQGESITYRLDGKALLATSEGKQSPLIQVLRN
jgi:hypothetical protein